ncbi:MAG: hypothetical protein Q9162_000001 [Coniocarpon cinnabarinum]
MLDVDRTHPRRERTFAGGECVVCEEPLEHTLRGERILQLSCAHVSHEACFYEFIRESDSQSCPNCNAPLGLDSSRGGNVLDIEKLSNIVRNLVVNNNDQRPPETSSQTTPTPWEPPPHGHPAYATERDVMAEEPPYASNAHNRNESNGTYRTSGPNSGGSALSWKRYPEYDRVSVDSETASQRSARAKNPIPNPTVTIKSEFPTMTKSRQQQNLTCLVTVEVPEGKWQPDIEDLRSMRPRLSQTVERNHRHGQSNASARSAKQVKPQPPRMPETSESEEELMRVTDDLHARVDNWHGLDFSRFGKLLLHDTVKVGKDGVSWQELECYLFAEMLICVKERPNQRAAANGAGPPRTRCVLKGSIMIKKHLSQIETSTDANTRLTLNLTVPELPTFHLHFNTIQQLEVWRDAFIALNNNDAVEKMSEYDEDISQVDDDEDRLRRHGTTSSVGSYGQHNSYQTPNTEYSEQQRTPQQPRIPMSLHVPVDIVLVVPVSSSMHSLKITLLRDLLKFMIQSLGGRDRLGLVTFGSSSASCPLVPMTNKAWPQWPKVIDSIKSAAQKSPRSDPVDGAKVAMDILMERKISNPLSSIMVISDSSSSESNDIDFVVQRAEAAKVSIYTFGLGLTHKPDAMIELSTRTKAAYTYIKDWMMLRECVAGCLGSLQSISHQNVLLKLKLPEGSPARFYKTSGALQITKRANGRETEASLGDFRFGEKRDILVQLSITPEAPVNDDQPRDAWDSIVSGLEKMGDSSDQDESRTLSVEEVPIIQASLTYGDVLRDGITQHSPRPCLLAITMLPASTKKQSKLSPSIPPHPLVVQRRMELLASDMLQRALTLVARGKHEQAHDLLRETRSILKGLGKGSLPPVPSQAGSTKSRLDSSAASVASSGHSPAASDTTERRHSPPPANGAFASAHGIDPTVMTALDAELESSLEWINHPAVFQRDSRKAVLEKIGVISSQRAYTFRTALETLYAQKIPGIRMLYDESRSWPEPVEEPLEEEDT